MTNPLHNPYRKLIESLPCGICKIALDEAYTLLYANRFYFSLYGYTLEQATLAGFVNVKFCLPPKDFQQIQERVRNFTSQKQQNFELEFRGIHSSGKLEWFLARCTYDEEEPDSLTCILLNIEDRKQMEERLRISIEENELAFHLTGKIMHTYDVKGRRLIQPEESAREFGLPPVMENAPYSVVATGTIATESIEEYVRFYESMVLGEPSGYAAVKKRRKDGSYCWHSSRYALVYDQDGNPSRGIIACEDITEQHEKELAFQKWSQYFAADSEGRIGYYEYNLTRNLFDDDAGDTPPDYLRRLKTYTETIVFIAEHFVYEEDREKFYHFFDREKLLVRYYDGQRNLHMEYRRKEKDGAPFWARATVQLISDPYNNDIKMFMVNHDIHEKKLQELAMQCRIENDPLTGLLNRSTLISRITEILSKNDFSIRHAFIMLDIDNFKGLNDSYGHQYGDKVLAEIAGTLKRLLRKYDLCGRLGGDEFILFLNNVANNNGIETRLERLCVDLTTVYSDSQSVSGSMGVAYYPRDGVTFEELYRKADIALYEAKKSGRSRYAVYHPDMESASLCFQSSPGHLSQ